MNGHRAHIVVGVVPGQPAAVLTEAAMFARHFDADLVCAFVDAGRYVVEELPDGTVTSLSINPDLPDLQLETFAPELRAELAAALDGQNVRWSTRALAGGPAQALARLADQLDAKMIVVGTRKAGFRGTVHEFINGSVAAQLTHRQHRPVVVIPLNPVTDDGELPWNTAE
jgi:nucleotide-binding universal stress UspA family protein